MAAWLRGPAGFHECSSAQVCAANSKKVKRESLLSFHLNFLAQTSCNREASSPPTSPVLFPRLSSHSSSPFHHVPQGLGVLFTSLALCKASSCHILRGGREICHHAHAKLFTIASGILLPWPFPSLDTVPVSIAKY